MTVSLLLQLQSVFLIIGASYRIFGEPFPLPYYFSSCVDLASSFGTTTNSISKAFEAIQKKANKPFFIHNRRRKPN